MKKFVFQVAAVGAVLISTSLVSVTVQACQPPPAWYHFFGSLNAISDSQDIRNLIGYSVRPTSIKEVANDRYEIEAGACKLGVTIQTERLSPNAPCGGPITFTAIPDAGLLCKP